MGDEAAEREKGQRRRPSLILFEGPSLFPVSLDPCYISLSQSSYLRCISSVGDVPRSVYLLMLFASAAVGAINIGPTDDDIDMNVISEI